MFQRVCLVRFLLSFLLLVGFTATAHAITIETFEDFQSLEVSPPNSAVSSISSNFSLGGTRSLEASAISGPGGSLTVETTQFAPFRLKHSQDVGVTGISRVHWDGDLDPNSIDFTGLGGLDLTQDGATALTIEKVSFDFPAGSPVSFTFTVYDASDPTGQTYSAFTQVLDQSVVDLNVVFPFDSPDETGPLGPADFSNVGAIELFIDGENPSIDLSLEGIVTNGTCPLFPDGNGSVFDECGECLAPDDPDYNTSCADCLGIPNGNALPGTSCDTGDSGICSDGEYSADCDCTRLFDPTVEVCDEVDNDCDGQVDETFPQLGEVCGAGEGECLIEGIFICDDNGGMMCDADFDPDDFEECSDIIGCDGIPGSGLVDDECGICGGDGSACEGCDSFDITETQFALDGGAKHQERLIIKITNRMKELTQRKRTLKWIDETLTTAHDLQIVNWVLSWTLPNVITDCVDTEFCVTTSNVEILNDYRSGSIALRDLGREAFKRLRRVQKSRRGIPRWRKRVNRTHNENMALADTVPEEHTVCVFG